MTTAAVASPTHLRKPKPAPAMQTRVESVIESLGSATLLAELLHVHKSQPTQWRHGRETPSTLLQQRILDLDHVMAAAQLVWEREVALEWLRSPNSHLDGAVPMDVLELRGPAEVLDARDAVLSGAYA